VQAPWFLDAGADILTFHAEACDNLAQMEQLIKLIHDAGAKAAISLKPKTSTSTIADIIEQLDMVLIMSVEPGFSGQSYIEGSDKKVAEIVTYARNAGVSPLIEVDGGIGIKTAPIVCAAGADVLVCGNAAFGADDPIEAIASIEKAGNDARLLSLS